MVIRPMAAAYAMGEIGRPVNKSGAMSGPASFLYKQDSVALGSADARGAGLYSASPLFKIMGAVELMTGDGDFTDNGQATFGDNPVLV